MAAGVVNTGNPVGNASVALDGTWSVPGADAVATVGTARSKPPARAHGDRPRSAPTLCSATLPTSS